MVYIAFYRVADEVARGGNNGGRCMDVLLAANVAFRRWYRNGITRAKLERILPRL